MELTDQQQSIIDYAGNAVIVAMPGSGKTLITSEKIRLILPSLKSYQGVIAISYTNKASKELKDRTLRNGLNPKSSFFGTIDGFMLSEIVIPYGKQLFGLPEEEIRVQRRDTLPAFAINELSWLSRDLSPLELTTEKILSLKNYFLKGIIVLESVGTLCAFILSNSKACNAYLAAKYTNVFIDEYQDAGKNQHELFLHLMSCKLIGVAVGDVQQSIYEFSGKSSSYLESLLANVNFANFKLAINHRCHPSIINYSNRLLDGGAELLPTSENRMFLVRVSGAEEAVANWLDRAIPKLTQRYSIEALNRIGILTRNNRTASLIDRHLVVPHRFSVMTPLDESPLVWSQLFVELLRFSLNDDIKFIDLVEMYVNYESLTHGQRRDLAGVRDFMTSALRNSILDVKAIVQSFEIAALTIAAKSNNYEALSLLENTLRCPEHLQSYTPSTVSEINIMTLHKSKGLEFDAVFHLDLHEWILPSRNTSDGSFREIKQDLNLHYVGITRAIEACVLITSTQRTNFSGRTLNAADSEFLLMPQLEPLRKFVHVN